MKSLIAILIIGYFSWNNIDFLSESSLDSIVFPLVFMASLIAFCLWLVVKGGITGRTNDRGDCGSSGFFGDGGDGCD